MASRSRGPFGVRPSGRQSLDQAGCRRVGGTRENAKARREVPQTYPELGYSAIAREPNGAGNGVPFLQERSSSCRRLSCACSARRRESFDEDRFAARPAPYLGLLAALLASPRGGRTIPSGSSPAARRPRSHARNSFSCATSPARTVISCANSLSNSSLLAVPGRRKRTQGEQPVTEIEDDGGA
jgi:hypothetical protein